MFQILFFIAVVLLIAFIIVLIAVGLCIGIAQLMIYFIPTLELTNVLVPAAILTTVLIFMIGNVFKSWVSENAKNARILLSDDDDYEDDDDEPEPPSVTTIRSYRNTRNRRWK
jgi:energy-coupling factor transporter transmembrane protein EcfT